jgi:hypothetical protein
VHYFLYVVKTINFYFSVINTVVFPKLITLILNGGGRGWGSVVVKALRY